MRAVQLDRSAVMNCDKCGAEMVKLRRPEPVATLGYRYRCRNEACRRTVQEVTKGEQRYVPVHEARRPER